MPEILNQLKSYCQNKLLKNSFLFVIGACSILGFAPYKLFVISFICYAGLYLVNESMRFSGTFCFFAGQTIFGCYWLYNSIVNFGMLPKLTGAVLTLIAIAIIAFIPAALGLIAKKFRAVSWPVWLWLSEVIRSSYLFSGFPWLLLGYTQIHTPWYKYIFYLGVHGTTLLTALVITCLCEAVKRQKFILCLPIIAWALTGFYLGKIPKKAPTQKYCFQTHRSNPNFEVTANALSHASKNIDISIWPEGVMRHPLTKNEISILKKTKVLTIFGGITKKDSKIFNSTIAVYPGGKITQHEKYNIVAFGEYLPLRKIINKVYDAPFSDLTPASSDNNKLIKFKQANIMPIMCYDIGFSNWMKPEVQRADFLISLHQMHWFSSRQALAQQIEMAQARSIETAKPQIFIEPSLGHILIGSKGRLSRSSCIAI